MRNIGHFRLDGSESCSATRGLGPGPKSDNNFLKISEIGQGLDFTGIML